MCKILIYHGYINRAFTVTVHGLDFWNTMSEHQKKRHLKVKQTKIKNHLFAESP